MPSEAALRLRYTPTVSVSSHFLPASFARPHRTKHSSDRPRRGFEVAPQGLNA